MISLKELLMGRAEFKDLPKDVQDNIMTLLERINKIRTAYGKPMLVSSGYRTPESNDATANAAKASNHLIGAAVDIADKDVKLWNFVVQNLQLCKDTGLWLEDKRWTPNWVHFQIFPPKSGKRIYRPSMKPALDEKVWSGKYDNKYD